MSLEYKEVSLLGDGFGLQGTLLNRSPVSCVVWYDEEHLPLPVCIPASQLGVYACSRVDEQEFPGDAGPATGHK